MLKVCLTHMISWPDRLGLPLWHTSGDDCLLTMILRVMNLYDTNGSQVRQEFVQKIGKVFDAILEKTGKLRKETKGDIYIAKAIAIVLERNPHLGKRSRYTPWSQVCISILPL